MSRKHFFIFLLIGILLSACGAPGSSATQQAAPAEIPEAAATEAPAATEAAAHPQPSTAFSEPQFTSVSAEAATRTDANLYQSLSSVQATALNNTALAVSIKNLDPARIPMAPTGPRINYQAGDTRTFWVRNSSTLQFNQITAQLMIISEHAYFWQDLEITQQVPPEAWAAAAESFDNSYKRVRTVFGSEESLGLDGDPRLFVVHSEHVGEVGGYFSEVDQLPAMVEAYSNEGQFFFVSNSKTAGIASEYYKETLAHEFQHMVQKNVDSNEEAWLNEGLSMLAQQIAGMRGDNWVENYLDDPDQSLWYWSKNSADYGHSYLYLEYLHEQLGVDFIKALAANPFNGAVSIDQTLNQFKSTRNADALYMDAISAAFFNDLNLQNSPLRYQIPALPVMFPTYESESPISLYHGTVQQYGGVDILTFIGDNDARLDFRGDQRVKLIPTDAHSGNRFWWSNRNDSSFATLTRKVDLRQTQTATLKYWAWYDIEKDWDYAYLMVSTDNGAHWTPIATTSSRETDPNGQNYGHGFSGISGNGSEAAWIQEAANLNAYAGRQILLRFAMQNNPSVNNFGFAVDDLSIAEIGWSDNIEMERNEWIADGFITIHNHVPQTWGVRAVEQKMDGSILVHDLDIRNGTARLDVDFSNLNRLVVFIIGQTRYTTLPASYQISVSP
jgi:immune inhibitor A